MRISDWSSDVCSSDLVRADAGHTHAVDFQRLAALEPIWRLRRPDQPGEAVLFDRVEPTDAVAVDAQRRAFVDAQPGHVGHDLATPPGDEDQIGSASCRERVVKTVLITVDVVAYKKKDKIY